MPLPKRSHPTWPPKDADLETSLRKRLKDAQLGIGPGEAADLSGDGNETPLPADDELGIPTAARRKLREDVAQHISVGNQLRALEKVREDLTARIKLVLDEWVPMDEVPSFVARGVGKITQFIQNRTTFSKDAARDELLRLGVSPDKIRQAWDVATTVRPTRTLLCKPLGQSLTDD